MGKRMTIQTAVVTGYEFDKNPDLRNLHGQTVTVLCGSSFYHTETEETMRIDRDLQNLICTDDHKYVVVDSKALLTDHTYMKTGYGHYEWNPCTPEKWKELQDKKAGNDDFSRAVESIPNNPLTIE